MYLALCLMVVLDPEKCPNHPRHSSTDSLQRSSVACATFRPHMHPSTEPAQPVSNEAVLRCARLGVNRPTLDFARHLLPESPQLTFFLDPSVPERAGLNNCSRPAHCVRLHVLARDEAAWPRRTMASCCQRAIHRTGVAPPRLGSLEYPAASPQVQLKVGLSWKLCPGSRPPGSSSAPAAGEVRVFIAAFFQCNIEALRPANSDELDHVPKRKSCRHHTDLGSRA